MENEKVYEQSGYSGSSLFASEEDVNESEKSEALTEMMRDFMPRSVLDSANTQEKEERVVLNFVEEPEPVYQSTEDTAERFSSSDTVGSDWGVQSSASTSGWNGTVGEMPSAQSWNIPIQKESEPEPEFTGIHIQEVREQQVSELSTEQKMERSAIEEPVPSTAMFVEEAENEAGMTEAQMPQVEAEETKTEKKEAVEPEHEDFLLKQIDAFREKAAQLQQLLNNRENKVAELQVIVEEREEEAEKIQQVLDERKEAADEVMNGVQNHMRDMFAQVESRLEVLSERVTDRISSDIQNASTHSMQQTLDIKASVDELRQQINAMKIDMNNNIYQKLDSMKVGLTEDISRKMDSMKEGLAQDVSREMRNMRQGLTEDVTREMSSMKSGITEDMTREMSSMKSGITENMTREMRSMQDGLSENVYRKMDDVKTEISENIPQQMEEVKRDLSEKIHTEDVQCFRNMSDLIADLSRKVEDDSRIEEKVEPVKKQMSYLTALVFVNLIGLIISLIFTLGIL